MSQSSLKMIRVVMALIIFSFLSFMFLDFHELIPPRIISGVLSFQFVPSLLKFLTVISISAGGFMALLILTAVAGRVYCSVICPLGILQDIISWFKKKIIKRWSYRYMKPFNYLRYGFLTLTVIFFVSGSVLLVSLLDPYSNFGRISADFFRPLFIGLNNLLAALLAKWNVYSLYPGTLHTAPWQVYIYPSLIFALLLWLSIRYGRMFCNAVCPVGTILGLLSRISFFRIRIDESLCVSCRNCTLSCKSGCIDVRKQHIDFSRCVACYNCITACPERAIGYQQMWFTHKLPRRPVEQRRQFLILIAAGLTGWFGFHRRAMAQEVSGGSNKPTLIWENKTNPVTPPGSLGKDHFTATCTACHLCVTACPTGVLQPSLFEYGLAGIMQPHMDYHTNYCHYECVICSEVCPTGAILSLSREKKETTQLGQVHLILENCVVYTENTACGSCSEHCPTQAVRMIPYINDLTIPEMRPEICVGCGACEYACPTRPFRAIFVDGHPEHQVAGKPEKEKLEKTEINDFPF